MITTIIIFGSNGMLGTYLTRYFNKLYRVIPLTRSDFNILTDLQTLEKTLETMLNETTCVINCCGLIPQRVNNKFCTDYYIINTVFPLHLSKICTKFNTKLICPTTDCVYTGNKGSYVETDFHDETNAYGISKSLGEPIEATVIRTSIIGEELQNKYSFLEFVKNAKGTINGYSNHLWNGITCHQYCKIVDKIIKENLFWRGVRHIYSPEKKSKYDLACIIKEVYSLDIDILHYNAPIVIDKTLASRYEPLFVIPSLECQIMEQKGVI